jgi:hypothetical protein
MGGRPRPCETGYCALEQSGQLLLQLNRPAPVQVDFSTDGSTLTILAPEAPGLQLRVLAPLAQEVTFNGTRLAFRRDGDYCVIPLPAPSGP